MPLLPLGACTQLFPRDHTECFPSRSHCLQPLPPAPPQHRASLCPSSRFCSPRPQAWSPASPHPTPAPALRSCETRCLRPAGARAAVRPNIDAKSAPPGTEFGGCGGGGRRRLFPPDTPPDPLAAAAAVSAGSTWSGAGRGALTPRLLCGGAWGCAGGRGRRQDAGTASPGVRGVWGPGVWLRDPAAACDSRGRAPLQSQLPLPSTCGGGASCGAGPIAGRGLWAPPLQRGKVER